VKPAQISNDDRNFTKPGNVMPHGVDLHSFNPTSKCKANMINGPFQLDLNLNK
jgi:hypothetical protein